MRTKSTFVLAMLIALLLSIGGVNAQWFYFDTTANLDISQELEYTLSEYQFGPEVVLPDKEAALGENHHAVVTNVTDHISYGLNADGKKSIVKKLIFEEGYRVVYSQQKVSNGNLKQMLVSGDGSGKVQFAVAYQSYDCLITYTFLDTYLDSESASQGKLIDVYKTETVYDLTQEKWIAARSYLGTAPVKRITVENKSF